MCSSLLVYVVGLVVLSAVIYILDRNGVIAIIGSCILSFVAMRKKQTKFAAICKICDGMYEISIVDDNVTINNSDETFKVPSDEIYKYIDYLDEYVIGSDCELLGTIDIPGEVCDYAEDNQLSLESAYLKLHQHYGYSDSKDLLNILLALQK